MDVSMLIGHKEWAPTRKTDPRYDMNWRRASVANFTGDDMATGEDVWGTSLPKRGMIGPASAGLFLTHAAVESSAAKDASLRTEKLVQHLTRALGVVSQNVDDIEAGVAGLPALIRNIPAAQDIDIDELAAALVERFGNDVAANLASRLQITVKDS